MDGVARHERDVKDLRERTAEMNRLARELSALRRAVRDAVEAEAGSHMAAAVERLRTLVK